MLHHDRNDTYFTKAEALALVGRTVDTNAGCKVKIVGWTCEGPGRFSVYDEKDYNYAKSSKNGLYISLVPL